MQHITIQYADFSQGKKFSLSITNESQLFVKMVFIEFMEHRIKMSRCKDKIETILEILKRKTKALILSSSSSICGNRKATLIKITPNARCTRTKSENGLKIETSCQKFYFQQISYSLQYFLCTVSQYRQELKKFN